MDGSTSRARQKEAFELVRTLIQRDYPFKDKEEARRFFTRLTGIFKNLNYAAGGSPEHVACRAEIDDLVRTLGRPPPPANTPEARGEAATGA